MVVKRRKKQVISRHAHYGGCILLVKNHIQVENDLKLHVLYSHWFFWISGWTFYLMFFFGLFWWSTCWLQQQKGNFIRTSNTKIKVPNGCPVNTYYPLTFQRLRVPVIIFSTCRVTLGKSSFRNCGYLTQGYTANGRQCRHFNQSSDPKEHAFLLHSSLHNSVAPNPSSPLPSGTKIPWQLGPPSYTCSSRMGQEDFEKFEQVDVFRKDPGFAVFCLLPSCQEKNCSQRTINILWTQGSRGAWGSVGWVLSLIKEWKTNELTSVC